jgi:hypothetical protein
LDHVGPFSHIKNPKAQGFIAKHETPVILDAASQSGHPTPN